VSVCLWVSEGVCKSVCLWVTFLDVDLQMMVGCLEAFLTWFSMTVWVSARVCGGVVTAFSVVLCFGVCYCFLCGSLNGGGGVVTVGVLWVSVPFLSLCGSPDGGGGCLLLLLCVAL